MNVHEVTLMKAHLRTLRGYKRRLGGGEANMGRIFACIANFRSHTYLSGVSHRSEVVVVLYSQYDSSLLRESETEPDGRLKMLGTRNAGSPRDHE